MKTPSSKAVALLAAFASSLARAQSTFVTDSELRSILGRVDSSLYIAGPKEPVRWLNESYAAITSTGFVSLLGLVASMLLAIAAVNLINQALLSASLTPLRRQLLRFAFALAVVALFSTPTASGSLSAALLDLWGSAFRSSSSITYVTDVNQDFVTATKDVLLSTARYAAGATVVGAASTATASATSNKLMTASIWSKLLGGFITELSEIVNKISASVKKAALASSFAFLGLAFIYGIFVTLSGFTWLLGVVLLPLAAALYMFGPTQRVFSTVLSYMLSALFFVILLPLVLSITLRAVILPDMSQANEALNEMNAFQEASAAVMKIQDREIKEATLCLTTRGPTGRYGALVGTPSPKTTTLNLGGETYTLRYLDYDPAYNCSSTQGPELAYTSSEIQDAVANFFGDNYFENLNPGVMDNVIMSGMRYLITLLKAAIIGILAFFLFIGMMRIIGQLLGGVGIGASIENPLT